MIVIGNQSLLDIVNELIDTGNVLDAVSCHLYQNDVFPDATLGVDQFTEADFGGYAAFDPVVWNPAFIGVGGTAMTVGDTIQFQPSDSSQSNNIFGYWIQHGTGGSAKMVFAERLDTMVVLATPFDALVLLPRFSISQARA